MESLKGTFDGLVVCLSHSWGGLEQVAARDALEMGQRGLKVRVLCLKDTPIQEELKDHDCIELVPISYRPRDYFDFKLRKEINRLVDEGVNVIHLHQPTLLGSFSPWLWNRPEVVLVASRHIMNNHNKKNPFHAAIYRRVDAIIAMSQTLKENILQTHPLKDRQIKVIHLGLDFDRFDPEKVDPKVQREAWGVDDDTVVIGLVGRIDPAKGHGTFIKAAAGLMKNADEMTQLKFVIVGEMTKKSGSKFYQELIQLAEGFRIRDRIIFSGFHENIPEVMRAFDIFVMPSRQETFGLVAIEAMAMSCPVVISKGGSAEEIVGTYVSDRDIEEGRPPQEPFGLLVRPEDAFDLQVKLRSLIENAKMRREMGQRGREYVRAHYDRNQRVQQTLQLYERLLRRRGR